MTMVPAQNMSKPPHPILYAAAANTTACSLPSYPDVMTRLGDGCGYANHIMINNTNCLDHPSFLGSDLGINSHNNIIMADEEEHSRTSNSSTTLNNDAAVSSTSNKRSHQESSWLQLGMGDSFSKSMLSSLHHDHDQTQAESTAQTLGGGASGLMLDLNLGSGDGSSSSVQHHRVLHQTTSFAPEFQMPQRPRADYCSSFVSPPVPVVFPSQMHQQLISSDQMGWGFFDVNHHYRQTSPLLVAGSSSISPSSSSSASLMMPGRAGSFLTRPFTACGSSLSVEASDSEFGLIHPLPRRPHPGIWFLLQASLHQSKEPYLPQVSKSFLRIKDGRMTVGLVMKYLSNKLGLDCESEVEVRCRGQVLVPFLTLQHVRDQIWSSKGAVTLLSIDSSDYLMVLHYGRSPISYT